MEMINSMVYEVTHFAVIIGLAIAAAVCGSIDLKRMKTEYYSRISKGFDIAGIVLGTISGFPFIVLGISHANKHIE